MGDDPGSCGSTLPSAPGRQLLKAGSTPELADLAEDEKHCPRKEQC
jgi:hypothetical protein